MLLGASALAGLVLGKPIAGGIPAAVYRERLADISGVEAVRDEENWK